MLLSSRMLEFRIQMFSESYRINTDEYVVPQFFNHVAIESHVHICILIKSDRFEWKQLQKDNNNNNDK